MIDDFEKRLEECHEVYAKQSIALIEKLPVPTSQMPLSWLMPHGNRRNRFSVARILSGTAPFDYRGVIGYGAGARHARTSIAMEAKSNHKHKASMRIVPKGTKGSGLQEHQIRGLVAHHQFGGISAVVWRNGDLRGVITGAGLVRALERFDEGTRKSIPWASFTEYELPKSGLTMYLEDWLYTAIQPPKETPCKPSP